MGENNSSNTRDIDTREAYERDIHEEEIPSSGRDEKNSYTENISDVQERKHKKEKEKPKKDKGKQKKTVGRGFRGFLHLLQHGLIVTAVVSVFIAIVSSTVVVSGLNGNESFNLYASDRETVYEESELFQILYGRAVADIIRFGVIRSQLETDGEFDGTKVIDVTAYNYRDVGIPEQYVTAEYYLEDLLKWQKYGYEYTDSTLTKEQIREFLGDKTKLTIVDQDSQYYNTSDANYMKSDIGSYTFVDDVSSNMLPSDDQDGFYEEYGETTELTEIEVLKNRYKTVEGKNIEDYTSDLRSYNALCNNVKAAADSLAFNYEEYLSFQNYYDKDNTNVRYFIEKTVNGNTEYYTNMEDLIDFNEYGKYLYYSPSEMHYETNSAIKEETVRQILKGYDYAYPENVRVWVGVDTSYRIDDAFSQAAAGFYNYQPYFWQLVTVAILSIVLYFILLVYLTVNTGKEIDEEGNSRIRLSEFDKIPTEGALIILLVAILVLCLPFGFEYYWERFLTYENVNTIWFRVVLGAVTLFFSILFSFFYYSLVRRIKAKLLWKNSYLKRIVRKLSLLIWEVYDNGNIIVRTWVPYILFLLFNFLAMLAAFSGRTRIVFFLFALVVDMVIGVLLYLDIRDRQNIVKGIVKIAEGDFSYQVEQEKLHGDNLELAKSVNSIGNGIKNAVEISMKDERMKADLITNVSHDIKTPLTSIINYVDLIKREEVDNERVRSYIKVLDEKSQRLKQLTDDLVEASKISSGNINLHFEKINLTELLNQTIGEFSEKFEQKELTIVMNVNTAAAVIEADSRSIWRVMENLFNNICKYALEGTRVYVAINALTEDGKTQEVVELSIKNISAMALNCNPEELTERFIRGDESRTTEGSGLGLSIAKNLVEAQHGTFEIQLDGDLFKVILTFRMIS